MMKQSNLKIEIERVPKHCTIVSRKHQPQVSHWEIWNKLLLFQWPLTCLPFFSLNSCESVVV